MSSLKRPFGLQLLFIPETSRSKLFQDHSHKNDANIYSHSPQKQSGLLAEKVPKALLCKASVPTLIKISVTTTRIVRLTAQCATTIVVAMAASKYAMAYLATSSNDNGTGQGR